MGVFLSAFGRLCFVTSLDVLVEYNVNGFTAQLESLIICMISYFPILKQQVMTKPGFIVPWRSCVRHTSTRLTLHRLSTDRFHLHDMLQAGLLTWCNPAPP